MRIFVRFSCGEYNFIYVNELRLDNLALAHFRDSRGFSTVHAFFQD